MNDSKRMTNVQGRAYTERVMKWRYRSIFSTGPKATMVG